MTVMGERLPEAWMVEWHRNRRVEFPLRRWSFLQFPLLLVIAPVPMVLGNLPDLLADDVGRFLGYLTIVAYAGIHQGRRSRQWSDIGSVGLIRGPRPIRQLPVHPKTSGPMRSLVAFAPVRRGAVPSAPQ